MLRYDALVAHDKPEDYEESPLDKLAARSISGLIKSRERQQRVARHHKAMQDGAKGAAAAPDGQPDEEEDADLEAGFCSELGMSGSESELSL